jgi:hypothetical protein
MPYNVRRICGTVINLTEIYAILKIAIQFGAQTCLENKFYGRSVFLSVKKKHKKYRPQ